MAIDRITTGAVLDGAIQTADIANLAVDDTKLKDGAVTQAKMAVGAAFVTGMVMPYAGIVDNGSNPVPPVDVAPLELFVLYTKSRMVSSAESASSRRWTVNDICGIGSFPNLRPQMVPLS